MFLQMHTYYFLLCRQQKLQLRPAMEEVKAKYFREMKKFIGIPNVFKGVGDGTGESLIFPAIIDRNAVGFITCYRKADLLFQRLTKEQEKFQVNFYSIIKLNKLL